MIWRWKDWGPTKVTTVTRGPVLEAKRGRRLVFGWNNPPTTVTLDFERHADGTIVRLRDSGYPDIPQGRRDLLECASGGGEAVTLLKFFVEHGLVYEQNITMKGT